MKIWCWRSTAPRPSFSRTAIMRAKAWYENHSAGRTSDGPRRPLSGHVDRRPNVRGRLGRPEGLTGLVGRQCRHAELGATCSRDRPELSFTVAQGLALLLPLWLKFDFGLSNLNKWLAAVLVIHGRVVRQRIYHCRSDGRRLVCGTTKEGVLGRGSQTKSSADVGACSRPGGLDRGTRD